MKKNVGSVDRVIRIGAGIGLLSWTVFGGGPLWGYIGIVPLLTGAIGWCPPYALLGLSTCRKCS